MPLTRRSFLARAAASGAAAAFGAQGAFALPRRGGDAADLPALVVLQLAGGNDGLSTVVPFADDAYRRLRKATRVEPHEVLKLDEATGLHPNLKGLRALYGDGKLAVVRGAGYPDPNRSHFESYEIWHAADRRGRDVDTGWLGRAADLLSDDATGAAAVVHLGKQAPFSLTAKRRPPVVFETPDAYRWIGGDKEAAALADSIDEDPPARAGRDEALGKVRRALREAQASSAAVRAAAKNYRPKADYPRSPLAGALRTAAGLVAGGVGVRIFSLEMGGFDTHVGQRPRHDALMTQLGDALRAFYDDLGKAGLDRRVTTLVFSEFGRRAAENGSAGTDHGAASCLFVAGGAVRGGLYGAPPDLEDLSQGDPRFTVDFRRVYASLLERVIGVDAAAVLGRDFPSLPLF
jgi:uncharacterized protein (DUF1501 family)